MYTKCVLTVVPFTNQVTNVLIEVVPYCKSCNVHNMLIICSSKCIRLQVITIYS